jgi:Pyrimidine reductase, riboflavin biosynthesis
MIADKNHFSEWISSEASRKYVHTLRSKYDAVLIGANTAKIDDPKLTVRMVEGRNPYRIVLDSGLKLNPDLKLFRLNDDKKLF